MPSSREAKHLCLPKLKIIVVSGYVLRVTDAGIMNGLKPLLSLAEDEYFTMYRYKRKRRVGTATSYANSVQGISHRLIPLNILLDTFANPSTSTVNSTPSEKR